MLYKRLGHFLHMLTIKKNELSQNAQNARGEKRKNCRISNEGAVQAARNKTVGEKYEGQAIICRLILPNDMQQRKYFTRKCAFDSDLELSQQVGREEWKQWSRWKWKRGNVVNISVYSLLSVWYFISNIFCTFSSNVFLLRYIFQHCKSLTLHWFVLMLWECSEYKFLRVFLLQKADFKVIFKLILRDSWRYIFEKFININLCYILEYNKRKWFPPIFSKLYPTNCSASWRVTVESTTTLIYKNLQNMKSFKAKIEIVFY